MARTYKQKRNFQQTPEPSGAVDGNVDPGRARPGPSFVIQQHYATRLHHDLRLEMMNGQLPVLVSWAVPRGLPSKRGESHLAVHVEDHPLEYGGFEGTIPEGNYGAGEVRIFDRGTYELLEQAPGKLTFRLKGKRLQGVYHLTQTSRGDGKDEWLAFLKSDERPARDDLPPLAPMLATLVRDAFDDDGWLFEPKWDGVRTIAVCTRDDTVLMSRNQRDITDSYPELAQLHQRLVALDAIVDGEVVAFEHGRPSFERLQSRINLHNERDIQRATKSCPVTFIAFDLLYLDGRSLLAQPLEQRKDLLAEAVVPSERVQVSPYVHGEGSALADAARAQNLEGIVAKKLRCPYRPGKRSRDWLKIKVTFDADVVIAGWSRGEGTRSSTFGSLLLASYDDGELRYVGSVGTGFSDKTLDRLLPELHKRETDAPAFATDPVSLRDQLGKPLKDVRWVRPELVATVEFRELTSAGKLRAPSFKGLRDDKEPEECRFDELAPRPA